jgi:RNA polymerase sigma factor (sigma-70 family)
LVQRGSYTATLRHIAAAALCFLALHRNKNEFASTVAMPWPAGIARLISVELTDFSNARATGEECRAGEVLLVPMSRKDFDAELNEWAKRRWLETLVPPGIAAEADRQEIAQEALRKVTQRGPAHIRDPAKLRSYGATVVNNLAADWFASPRSGAKHVPATTALLDRTYFVQGLASERPEGAYVREQNKGLVRQAFGMLPRRRQEILWLMRVEGLSGPEVAKRLGLSVHTVYSECAIALTQFRKLITELTGDGHRREG